MIAKIIRRGSNGEMTMTIPKNRVRMAMRWLVLIGLLALLLMPLGAPSAGDGGGGPPVPFDSSGYFDSDTTLPDTLIPSL